MGTTYNRLSAETSPYLLQHATNPVNWFPWGNEAFTKAKQENKLMLISVGYSSCHWCHVMEREAFTNKEVADFMNQNYVCVKVDREERPDVDQIYMNAVQIITRSGGWPLNCFALPDGRPVFGGTYFPVDSWLDILHSLQSTWVNEPERVLEVVHELTLGVSNTEIIQTKKGKADLGQDLIKKYVKSLSAQFDTRYGGFKGAPKFPMPGSLQFLIDYSSVFADNQAKEHVRLTLDKISKGGIYDHLGGGFFRYSVDDQWHVPHFEKMLYDNAQLVSLYTNAYKLFGDENLRTIVYRTIDFLRREMRSPDGGYYSAIDADSDGEEGMYYTFTKNDVDSILGSNAELFSVAYGVSAAGNLHAKNVLRLAASYSETACVFGLQPNEVEQKLKDATATLFSARADRVRPITDDKQIVSWNALLVNAFTNAYVVFGDKRFLNDAISCANFIADKLTDSNGMLFRSYCKGKASIPAFLDDYAFLIQAYISLYKATFDEGWLKKANGLLTKVLLEFHDEKSGMFFFSSHLHDNIIIRKMELTDGVIPSSGAIMAENLIEMGVYFRNKHFVDLANQMLYNISDQFERGGPYVYKWASVYLKQLISYAEVGAAGEKASEFLRVIASKTGYPNYIPFCYSADSDIPISSNPIEEGYIKLCEGNRCLKPTNQVSDIINDIEKLMPLM